MDDKVMELRLQQWLPIFEEQLNSGLNKQDFCEKTELKEQHFLNGREHAGLIFWQRILIIQKGQMNQLFCWSYRDC